MRHGDRPLGLIVIDLDGFKSVNDTQGHAAGDALLCRVAVALGEDLRPSDVLGRLGGDEFAVLLPETGPDALRAAAERIGRHLRLVERRLARPRVPPGRRRDRRGTAPQRRRGPLPRQAAPRRSP